ncbi:hypothetical protein [Pseudonocardia sp. KRD291]|uniref:hypothetical protein n=1 Tax=Pseudonocardia sp. KRD291 TaxID=2792007 RepID=UPI001C49E249|nr:hypothetical protein [Pseudonocardia sp. KRD291]MBW0102561.1 hypothetical protein [Pseudonocardia sp. KRD291]
MTSIESPGPRDVAPWRLRAAHAVDGVGMRAVLLGLVTVVAIAVQAELRLPTGVPGHRGVLWLGLLVATALTARRAGVTTAVGLASAGVLLGTGIGPNGVLGVAPYVLAAAAVDAVLLAGVVRRHPVLLAVLAAPIHLVALVVPLTRSLRVGVTLPAMLPGMTTVIALHVLFGLGAGLAGWGLSRAVTRAPR